MAITGLDHIYMETRSLDKAAEFWEALGFVVATRWGDGDHRACLLKGAVKVVLVETSDEPAEPRLYFSIDKPELMNAQLRRNRTVEVVTPLSATHWGSRWIRVRDPDGHLFALEDVSGKKRGDS